MKKIYKYYYKFFVKYASFKLNLKKNKKTILTGMELKKNINDYLIYIQRSRYFFQFPLVRVWLWLLTPALFIINKIIKIFKKTRKLKEVVLVYLKSKLIKTLKNRVIFDLYIKKNYYIYKFKNHFIFLIKIYFLDSPLSGFIKISKNRVYNIF